MSQPPSVRCPSIGRHPPVAAVALAAILSPFAACIDLALEPDQVPSSLQIVPADARIQVGDQGNFRIAVLDADDQVMPGPPSWAPADWHQYGDSRIDLGADGAFSTTEIGDITVRVEAAGLRAWTSLLISPTTVRLGAPAIYFTQAVQTLDRTVPLVAGRNALLRVFATGDQVSYYEPRGHATFVQDGRVVHEAQLDPPFLIPDAVEERSLRRSVNAVIPGNVIQPGVEVWVDLDPGGAVPLAPGSQTRVPAEGTLALDVVELSQHRQTILPMVVPTDANMGIASATEDLTVISPVFGLARALMPIGVMSLTVHPPVWSGANLRTENGWGELIREALAVWVAEGNRGYYYGAVTLPGGTAYGGLGYVGYPVSVGALSDGIFAHELGHNLGLWHAPCGGAGNADRSFPYRDGSSGVWGYDFRSNQVIDPREFKDIMGYCSPDWISDYSFVRAMQHRLSTENPWVFGMAGGDGQAGRPGWRVAVPAGESDLGDPAWSASPREDVQPTLLLWGSAGDGELLLEPAFGMETVPLLPGDGALGGAAGAGGAGDRTVGKAGAEPVGTAGSGGAYRYRLEGFGPGRADSYRLEGFGPNGVARFAFAFAPMPLEFGGGHFGFAVPFDPARDGPLDRVVLSGPEGEVVVRRGSAPPMAIVIDPASGQVRAIVREWPGGAAAGGVDAAAAAALRRMGLPEAGMRVLVSDGLPGRDGRG